MPVIMCSSLTQRGAKVTIEALACGASDYVAKPAGQSGREAAIEALAQDLIPKIHALTSQPQPGMPPRRRAPPPFSPCRRRPVRSRSRRSRRCWPSASPPAAPAALDILLPALPANFPLPVLIVQHMPELFTKLFAERSTAAALCRCARPSRASRCAPEPSTSPRQLAHGGAGRRAHRLAAHAAPEPGPAGKPLPPRRRCALPLAAAVYGAACWPWCSPAWAPTE
jgi:two-component system, chemotaxis family, protein-glutamate methylesterase/glutaminase